MEKEIMLAVSLVLASIIIANTTVAADGVEVRGQVTDISVPSFTWNTLNFPGFFYDPDDNVGNEQITFRPSGVESESAYLGGDPDLDGNYGITYTTTAQPKSFKFNPWGEYNFIGFLGEGYFVAYDNTITQSMKNNKETVAYLYDNSRDKNLSTNEQISKVMIDDDTEQTITSDSPLVLREGYILSLKSVDEDRNIATLELAKDSKVIDRKIVKPSKSDATMADRTYYYKNDIGNAKGIVQIAVHFRNAFCGADTNIATVDGVFQISDKPISIEPQQQYDKMKIFNFDPDAMTITMANKDYRILLSKNKDTVLMQGIHIKTANQNVIDEAHPLRYYIYKIKTAEPEIENAGIGSKSTSGANENEAHGDQKVSSTPVNEGL